MRLNAAFVSAVETKGGIGGWNVNPGDFKSPSIGLAGKLCAECEAECCDVDEASLGRLYGL